MADYGFKITRDGFDTTTTDLRGYIIDSKYTIPKTYIVGTQSFSFLNEADTEHDHTVLTLTHNLGYKPYCVMYFSVNGGNYSGSFWIKGQGNPHNCYEYIYYNVTSTQFIIQYKYHSGGGDGVTGIPSYNFNFKYYIFIDRGEP